MQNKIDISVIIPVFRVERYIEQALHSVFSQTKTQRVEYIIVDDASPDCSIELAKNVITNYPHLDVQIISNQTNQGIARTRQIGLDEAKGEYFIFIDSDDWCEPDMLETLFIKAKNLNADIIYCDYFLSYVNKDIYCCAQELPNHQCKIEYLIKDKISGYLWNKLFKRSTYLRSKSKFVQGMDLWEDLLFCIQLFTTAKQIHHIPKAFLHYRQNDQSITQKMNAKKLDSMIAAMHEIEHYLEHHDKLHLYSDALISRKLALQIYLLRAAKPQLRAIYSKQYESLTHYIDTHFLLGKLHKLALKAALNNRFFIFNSIYKILDFKSWFTRRIIKQQRTFK